MNKKVINKEAQKLYYEIIYAWSEYLNSISIKEIPVLIELAYTLLSDSYFSHDEFGYHKFKHDSHASENKFGYRVVSGKAVCRHTSKFFTDLFNSMGYNAYYISGYCIKQDQKNSKKDSGHAIFGIDGKTSYIYDSTVGDFLEHYDIVDSDKKFLYHLVNLIVEFVYDSNIKFRTLQYSRIAGHAFFVDNDFDNRSLLTKLIEQEPVDIDDIFRYESEASNWIDLNKSNLIRLKEKLTPSMQELDKLERILVPHHD